MRNAILRLLRSNYGDFVSGEDISHMLEVSRTAVWKHIQALRNAGYVVDSNPRQGYRLTGVPDLLLPNEILSGLKTKYLGRTVHHFTTVDSTNLAAKRLAAEGASEGTVVVAEQQSCGRGRMARRWFSPASGGIWFSLILRPRIQPAEAAKYTFLGAVAIAKAIRATTGLAVEIKWPNDIHFQGRKLVGILTELNAEVDMINYIVMGIGINVNIDEQEFPDDLRGLVTSVQCETGREFSRQVLLCAVLQEFEILYEHVKNDGFNSVFKQWRDINCTLGYEVNVSSINQQFSGVAVDVDNEGALLVKRPNGVVERVLAGDVSVRRR